MTRSALVVVLLRVICGVGAAIAGVLLLFSFFIFDNPAASRNPLAWNLAFAPVVYLGLYAYSLTSAGAGVSSPGSEWSPLSRALVPLIGVAWYGVAILLVRVFCGGSFGCTKS